MGPGGPLSPQLYDLFPWALRHLPGPHQELFRYREAVRGFISQEISRRKLRAPEASEDFISCYLAQITKVGLAWWRRDQASLGPCCTCI